MAVHNRSQLCAVPPHSSIKRSPLFLGSLFALADSRTPETHISTDIVKMFKRPAKKQNAVTMHLFIHQTHTECPPGVRGGSVPWAYSGDNHKDAFPQ